MKIVNSSSCMNGCRRGQPNVSWRAAARQPRVRCMGKPMGKPMSKIDTLLQVGRTFAVRDGMLRLQYELQRGSGLLSWRMHSVQGWDSWDLTQIAPGAQAEEMRTARRN